MNNFDKIGNFISELRKAKGFSQEELGKKLHVTKKAVSRWETGRGLPDATLLLPLAEILEVSVDEILMGELLIQSNIDADSKEKLERINYVFEYLLAKKLLQKIIIVYTPMVLATIVSVIKVSTTFTSNTLLDQFSLSSSFHLQILAIILLSFLIITIIFVYRLVLTIRARNRIR